jgi:ABC-type antimicrobial peptide transport system permease subunit
MEENKIMSPQIKGLLIALIVIILGIAGYFTGLGFSTWFNWVVNAIMLAAIIIACVHFANQKQGYVTFGNVFSHGFKITAVIAIIVLVYTLLAFTVLFPDMKEKIFEMQQAQMEKRGLDDDKLEQGMTMMKKYFMIFLVIGVIFGTLIWGSIASLIGAAVAKKKKINPIDQFPS